MAVNNYINLQRNDFFSPYFDGLANLKMSISPQSASQIYNSTRTITFVPFSMFDRVSHFVAGIGLMIPVINLVVSCALRYFATVNVQGSESLRDITDQNPRVSSLIEVVANPSTLLSQSDSVQPERTSPLSASFPHEVAVLVAEEGNGLIEHAPVAPIAETEELSLQVSLPQILPSPPLQSEETISPSDQATTPLGLSPSALLTKASRRSQRVSPDVILPRIPEANTEEEGASLDTTSLPALAETFSLGAGVAPYRLHHGEIEILIGRNRVGGTWSYFGGESDVDELSMHTAARRCAEVTGNFLGRAEDILIQLNEYDKIGREYKTYFMPLSDRNITAQRFLQPRLPLAKTEIAWVKMTDLLSVTKHRNSRLKIEGSQAILHPSFIATLSDPLSKEVLLRIGSIRSMQLRPGSMAVSSIGFQPSERVA